MAQYNFRAVGRARGLVELLADLRARRAEEGRGAEGLDGNYDRAAVQRALDAAVARFAAIAHELPALVNEMSAKSASAAVARELCARLPSLDFPARRRRGGGDARGAQAARRGDDHVEAGARRGGGSAARGADVAARDAAGGGAGAARRCRRYQLSRVQAARRRPRLHGSVDDGARSVARRRVGARVGARALRRHPRRRIPGYQSGAGGDGAARRRAAAGR